MPLKLFVGPWPLFQLLDPIQSIGLLTRGVACSAHSYVQFNWPVTVTFNWHMALLRPKHNSVGKKPACRRETQCSPMMDRVPVLEEYVAVGLNYVTIILLYSLNHHLMWPPHHDSVIAFSPHNSWELRGGYSTLSAEESYLRFWAELRRCSFLILCIVLPHPYALPRVYPTCKCEISEYVFL
jgi:hypothetical protein